MGIDFNAPQAQVFNCTVKLFDGHVCVLQRHGTQAHETIRVLGHDVGNTVVDIARQLGSKVRLRKIIVLKRCRRYRLDVNAHAVHILQPDVNVGQLGRPVFHLLGVDIARQLVGKYMPHLELHRIQYRGFFTHLGVEIVAMNVNARRFTCALRSTRCLCFGGGRKNRHRHTCLAAGFGGRSVVLVRGVCAMRGASKKHVQSALMLLSAISFEYLAFSEAKKALNSSGDDAMGSTPKPAKRSFRSALTMTLLKASL